MRQWISTLTNFYPRPPRGGRPALLFVPGIFSEFLSTPSARRATTVGGACDGQIVVFLSTPSARRATKCGDRSSF